MATLPHFQVTILPVERIVPYELAEVAPNAGEPDSLSSVVRNPLLVTPLEGGSYLLLDETSRFVGLVAEGITQVPVQICSRTQLQVSMESIALFGILPEHVEEIVDHSNKDIVRVSEGEVLPTGYLPVVVDFQDGQQVPLAVAKGDMHGFPIGLSRLLNEIDGIGRYAAHLSEWYQADPLVRCARADAILFPPRLLLDDIARATVAGDLLPADLVRISAENRILAIDFPRSVLRSAMPIDQKTAFLHDLIALRRQARRTSVVQGRVYILNL